MAGIADRLARGVDAARKRGFRDDAALPDVLEQIVLGDDVVAMLHQMHQQIEHLRLDRDDLAAAAQLAAVGVEQVVGELELQRCVPDCGGVYEITVLPLPRPPRGEGDFHVSAKNQAALKAKSSTCPSFWVREGP